MSGIAAEDAAEVVRRAIAAACRNFVCRLAMAQHDLRHVEPSEVDFVEDRAVERCAEAHVREATRTAHDLDDVRNGDGLAGVNADELKGVVHPLVEVTEADRRLAADETVHAELPGPGLAGIIE